MTFSEAEQAAMRRALELAATPGVPLGPNPRVGCVIIAADGTELAEGFHRGAGTPHAEAAALAEAGADARGATAVVTLEPCNHEGRTGPCARALAQAGVRRVVFAQADTNPVARGGSATLQAAGIEVAGGLLVDEARPAQPGVDVRGRARPPVRHLEVRHDPRRAQRGGRRHLAVGLLPSGQARHPPPAGAVRRDRRRHRHGRGGRPAADRPRRGGRPAATPAAPRGDGAARPRAGSTGRRRRGRDRAPAHPRPARGPGRAVRARRASTSSSKAARPWPRPSSAPVSSTRS